MAEIIHLPENIISKNDRNALESFAAHSIARGLVVRWHWARNNNNGDEIFQLFSGPKQEDLIINISRDSELDAFCATDDTGKIITFGPLTHLFSELEEYLVMLQGIIPPPFA